MNIASDSTPSVSSLESIVEKTSEAKLKVSSTSSVARRESSEMRDTTAAEPETITATSSATDDDFVKIKTATDDENMKIDEEDITTDTNLRRRCLEKAS